MNNEFKRLPDAELDIMNYIWEQNKAVSSADILEGLKNRRKWTLATVLNLLARLSDKGFVESKKQGKFKMYSHIVNRDEFKNTRLKRKLSRSSIALIMLSKNIKATKYLGKFQYSVYSEKMG